MKKLQKWLPGFLIFAVLLVSMLGGAAFGKYIYSEKLGGKVTITANLGTITLLEHEAIRDPKLGSYSLGTKEVTSNTYTIIPGLDIPKDPFVTVDKASPIPVYVFVEVVSALDGSAVSFEIDDANWKRLEIGGVPYQGANKGWVYYYTGGTGDAVAVTADISEIYILKNKQVIIGQELLHDTPSDLGLTFYACMGQAVNGDALSLIYDRAK